MIWEFVDSRTSKFNHRLWRLVEVSKHDFDPDELARFMEEPDSGLDGIRPWDCFAAVSDEEFEQICDHLRERIAAKKTIKSFHKEKGVSECAEKERLCGEQHPSRAREGDGHVP